MVARLPGSSLQGMRNPVAVLHNPHNLVCSCDTDCFCNRTRVGRAIKWRVSARFLSRLGIQHKNSELRRWMLMQGPHALREWKRQQDSGGNRRPDPAG